PCPGLLRRPPPPQRLGPVIDAPLKRTAAPSGRKPPALPCEIRFEAVTFAYEGPPVLRDVSLTWKPGEVLGVRGPNGSGKSTLLRLLLGLIAPTRGRISLNGESLERIDLQAWRRNVAYLPQRFYLPEKSTVYDAMRLTIPELTIDDAKEALIRTETWDRLRQIDTNADPMQLYVSTLSVGTRQ